jgi:predicted acyltransferase
MFLLVSNFGQLFDPDSSFRPVALLGRQLDHAPWQGLTAWDLVQPVFMFIVGVSMPFAITRKWNSGVSWQTTFIAALKRSLILLFLGWLIGSTTEQSSFTNVLAQLSVTYMVAFLLMRANIKWQLLVSLAVIILNDVIYQSFKVPGYDQPYTIDHNFGSWFDLFLTGALHDDGWVSFNAVPTIAHTVWGVMAGNILMKNRTPQRKVTTLFAVGMLGVAAGYFSGLYIPMIKRICTSSFVLASGGWALLLLAACYLIIDVWQKKKGVWIFAVVGMNPLFIYLFWHNGGTAVMKTLSAPVLDRLLGWTSPEIIHIVSVLTIAFMLWYVCYFLYRKNIFIRI